jgi:hypothetical protein
MELISEEDILRVLSQAGQEGISNAVISENLFRSKDSLNDLHSVKVIVSRKIKRLIGKNQVSKSGRKYKITEIGRAKLLTGGALKSNFLFNRNFENITMSFAAPKVDRLIMERKDFDEIFQKLDQVLGEVDGDLSIIINKKNVSRET